MIDVVVDVHDVVIGRKVTAADEAGRLVAVQLHMTAEVVLFAGEGDLDRLEGTGLVDVGTEVIDDVVAGRAAVDLDERDLRALPHFDAGLERGVAGGICRGLHVHDEGDFRVVAHDDRIFIEGAGTVGQFVFDADGFFDFDALGDREAFDGGVCQQRVHFRTGSAFDVGRGRDICQSVDAHGLQDFRSACGPFHREFHRALVHLEPAPGDHLHAVQGNAFYFSHCNISFPALNRWLRPFRVG